MTRRSTLLDEIDSASCFCPVSARLRLEPRPHAFALPRLPGGGLLVRETTSDDTTVSGTARGGGTRQLLLDGRQRVTSMYEVVRGTPPPFFEGDESSFTGIHFNVKTESFEFYAPTKMAGDSTWVQATELFRKGRQLRTGLDKEG